MSTKSKNKIKAQKANARKVKLIMAIHFLKIANTVNKRY